MKTRILFVSLHGSDAAQMAAAFVNAMFGDFLEACPATVEPRETAPATAVVMDEVHIKISRRKPRLLLDYIQRAASFDIIISLGDGPTVELFPFFAPEAKRLHWDCPNLFSNRQPVEERIARAREIRDLIKWRVESWCREMFFPHQTA